MTHMLERGNLVVLLIQPAMTMVIRQGEGPAWAAAGRAL